MSFKDKLAQAYVDHAIHNIPLDVDKFVASLTENEKEEIKNMVLKEIEKTTRGAE